MTERQEMSSQTEKQIQLINLSSFLEKKKKSNQSSGQLAQAVK